MNTFFLSKCLALGVVLGVCSAIPGYAASCADEGLAHIELFAIGTTSASNGGCAIGTSNNDVKRHTLGVNTDSVFGQDEWLHLGRLDRFGVATMEPEFDGGFTYEAVTTNKGIAGAFSVAADIFDTYSAYVIVAKGGRLGTLPEHYVAYLFNDSDGVSGTIQTPFAHTSDGSPRRFTKLSLYGIRAAVLSPIAVSGPAVVPLPASALILMSGLGALAVARSHKQRRGRDPV